MKWLLIIFLICLFPQVGYSALTSDTAWAVNASGVDTNGGCYDTGGSGTDYTDTETTSILDITDLAVTEAASTTATSAAAGFTSAMVDNCIHINSGTNFTAGFYEITAFTSSSSVTIDRDPTDGDGGDGSAGVASIGGALNEPEAATPGVVAGNTVHIKNGTYGTALNVDIDGTVGNPISWVGFDSTRGDYPTGTARPLIDCANTLANGIVADQTLNDFANIRVDDCTGDGVLFAGNLSFNFENMKSANNTGSGWDDSTASGCGKFSNVESSANGDSGIGPCGSSSGETFLFGGYIHDNTDNGIEIGVHFVFFSVFDTNGDEGVDNTKMCINSIAYGNSGANAIGFGSLTGDSMAINCGAYSNGQYGFEGNVHGIFDYNGYNGNTTADTTGITVGIHDVSSAPSMTDPANGDFTVSSSSPLLATGSPDGSTPNGMTGDYEVNIGVDQDDNAAGSSTDLLGVIQ